MKQSLRQRLLAYLLRQHGFVHSGDLQRLVMDNTSYMPRTTVRRLQELCESGEIEVRYEKGAALYRAVRPQNAPGAMHSTGTRKDHLEYAAGLVAQFNRS